MSSIPEIPLSIIGKDSFLPFIGMFFAKRYTENGWCHIVGRFSDAELNEDFLKIRRFEQRLRLCIHSCSAQSAREQIQQIWNVAREEELFSRANSTMVSLLCAENEVVLAGFGISGLWGSRDEDKNVWFPLLPDVHPLFEEEEIPSEDPHCLIFSHCPQHILVRPRPSLEGLSSKGSIAKRIFEVSR